MDRFEVAETTLPPAVVRAPTVMWYLVIIASLSLLDRKLQSS
jgi:hypothetical protein